MTMGPSGPEGPRSDGEPAPADPGEATAPYTPPTASTSTSDVPPAPPPPETGLPPGVGWSPPVPARQEVAPGLVFADTAARFVAYIIDVILVGITASIIAAPFAWDTPFDPNAPFSDAAFRTTEYTVLATVIGAIYFILSWTGGRRATLGQRILKIQVANAFDGRPLTLDQAVRRWLGLGDFLNLLGFTPGLGALTGGLVFIWMIVLLITTATSPTKQGLHDRFANSAVVRPTNAGNTAVVACLVIVLILVAIAVLSIVALVFLGSQVSDILSSVGDSV
jgi:uncharacterized RDD family membrane protein YckC